MTDPHTAIENEFGVKLPGDLAINVLEESPKVVYLVLPVNPENLPDEILDSVSGGTSSSGCWADCKVNCAPVTKNVCPRRV